jgi:argininosuccinate lyase
MTGDRPMAAPPHLMWGGRFGGGPSQALDALNRSLGTDHRLWPQDVAASRAWAHALGRAGVLTPDEEGLILIGLDRAAERLADGAALGAPDEDVHTLVERLLYEEIGAVAGKLHTGRSRNDQVATDFRLWTLDAIDQLDADLAVLGATIVGRAREGVDELLPGYTQPARPAGALGVRPARARVAAGARPPATRRRAPAHGGAPLGSGRSPGRGSRWTASS